MFFFGLVLFMSAGYHLGVISSIKAKSLRRGGKIEIGALLLFPFTTLTGDPALSSGERWGILPSAFLPEEVFGFLMSVFWPVKVLWNVTVLGLAGLTGVALGTVWLAMKFATWPARRGARK